MNEEIGFHIDMEPIGSSGCRHLRAHGIHNHASAARDRDQVRLGRRTAVLMSVLSRVFGQVAIGIVIDVRLAAAIGPATRALCIQPTEALKSD
jgi:hypothetical protein